MPRNAINYQNTIIYKLVCNNLNVTDTFVSYTTDFTNRKRSHKTDCNTQFNTDYNRKVYQIIRENDGWDNWSMIEIEKFPCNDRNEAAARARYYYELLNANMNSQAPTFDKVNKKIYMKKYRESNKEEISEYDKAYKEANKEKIKARNSKVYHCEICNQECVHSYKSRHLKSKIHLDALVKNELDV